MLELVDDPDARDEPRDAVVRALGELGREAPCSDADTQLAASVFAQFREQFREQQRGAALRRRRMITAGVVGLAAAAALALSLSLAPGLRGQSLQVDEGEFLVQQGRVASGAEVAVGEWVEPASGRACLRVAKRRVCGEQGSRMRVVDDETIELARGAVSADGAMAVRTPIGDVRGGDGGFELTFDEAAGAIEVGARGVTLEQDGAAIELAPGARATADGPEATSGQQLAAREPITPTIAEPATTPTEAVVAPPRQTDQASKPARPTAAPAAIESAGDMLAAARELAGRGKLAAAASAYQRLIDGHPDSSEARAALVSLGRVQAERGRHAAALTAFSRYIAGGPGPLSEEAHFGRIGALHAQGRTAERDRAVEALATAHPRSVYLARARKLAGQ